MAERADETICWVEACRGVRVDRFPECFAHLGPTARTEALARLRPGADLDVRGTELTAEQLAQVLHACRDGGGSPRVGSLRADGARFAARCDFTDLHVTGQAGFVGAHFATTALFPGARFERGASFGGAAFPGGADFSRAVFHRDAVFPGATFGRRALFVGAAFHGAVSFEDARFDHGATFDHATVAHDLRLENARFRVEVSFAAARFERVEALGPFLADEVAFDRAQFDEHVTVDLRAREPSLAGARLAGGGVLRLQGATVWLDRAVLGGTTAVVGAEVLLAGDTPAADTDRESVLGATAIASIRGVDAGQLVLSGVDLSTCRFSAAYQLDRLRIEGRCRFGAPPAGFHPPFPGWPPVWRWTRRRTIVEEHRWRARRPRRSDGWTAEHPEASRTFGWRQPTHAERVAALYRQLRKAFEDAKNEPEAADFYYGEMEMRRLSPGAPRGERFVLTLYWLVSGYGLRAGRALLGLVALVGVTTWLLAGHGFTDPGANTENALRTALNAVVFRSTAEELTTTGAYVEMVARVLGPILLALAALSVRNRVKR